MQTTKQTSKLSQGTFLRLEPWTFWFKVPLRNKLGENIIYHTENLSLSRTIFPWAVLPLRSSQWQRWTEVSHSTDSTAQCTPYCSFYAGPACCTVLWRDLANSCTQKTNLMSAIFYAETGRKIYREIVFYNIYTSVLYVTSPVSCMELHNICNKNTCEHSIEFTVVRRQNSMGSTLLVWSSTALRRCGETWNISLLCWRQ